MEIQEIRTALEAAAADRAQLCRDAPARCRRRPTLAPDKSPDDPGAWTHEVAPSYRAEHDLDLARLRPALRRTWLGLEYWSEITRALADRADTGELRERDAWLIMRKVREQSRMMLIEQIDHGARSGAEAGAWQAASVILLRRAVLDLNAYTATLTDVRQADDATSGETECTAAVAVLGDTRVCATADGGVTTR